MMKQTIRGLAAISIFLLLQTGCGTVRVKQETAKAPIVVKELARSSQSWDGALLPAYPQGQPRVTILRITIPAGAQLHTHHHLVINAGMLLSGELTVVARDGKTLQLKAGDPIIELVNTSHYGINHGKVPAEILVFYAGVTDAPITVVEPD